VTVRATRARCPDPSVTPIVGWHGCPAHGEEIGVPGPARSVISTRTPSPHLTATVTVSPGEPEPEWRTELPKISLTSNTATSAHGCPGPTTSETNPRAARARSGRPASVTVSRTATPAISAPAFPAALVPGNRAGHRADTGMHARLSGARQAKTRRRRGPSAAVRGNADGCTDRASGTKPVWFCLDVATALACDHGPMKRLV
jgi:hypothetical protein